MPPFRTVVGPMGLYQDYPATHDSSMGLRTIMYIVDNKNQINDDLYPGNRVPRFHSQRHQDGLPGDKIKSIRAETRKLLSQTEPSALSLARLLGKLNHATRAIPPAPLFYRSLQSCLRIALEEGNQEYSSKIKLSPEGQQELDGWRPT